MKDKFATDVLLNNKSIPSNISAAVQRPSINWWEMSRRITSFTERQGRIGAGIISWDIISMNRDKQHRSNFLSHCKMIRHQAKDDWLLTTSLSKTVIELSGSVKDVANMSKEGSWAHVETSQPCLSNSRTCSRHSRRHESHHPNSEGKFDTHSQKSLQDYLASYVKENHTCII